MGFVIRLGGTEAGEGGEKEKMQGEKEQAEQDMWLSLLVDSLRTNLRLCV